MTGALARLDDAQRAAVLGDDAATLVYAEVGSGKTTVLVAKAIHVHVDGGVRFDELAVLTFTNRAAGELLVRLGTAAGRELASCERRRIGTFHAVAHALLRRDLPIERVGHRPGFDVLDEDAQDTLLAEVARRERVRAAMRRRFVERRRAGRDLGGDSELGRLDHAYRDAKRAANAMDFDDLLDHATALLAMPGGPTPPRWILIDEVQDCVARERAFVRALRGPNTRLFGVGDPLQSIYGWRGGAADALAQLEAEHGCHRRHLGASYRSTRTILDGARAVLGEQPEPVCALRPVRGAGAPIAIRRNHDPVAEAMYLAARVEQLVAAGTPHREIAVLCRLRAQIAAIAARLRERGVPCVEDPDRDDGEAAGVRVSTMHAAKGLEFTAVFVCGVNFGIVPLLVDGLPEDPAEERRLFYVALTRARDVVEISYCAAPHEHGAIGEPSPFLRALPAACVSWEDAPTPAQTPPTPAATPWYAGQPVRHARYGAGVVVDVTADTIACEFGKLGTRSFPAAMCPLVAAP